MGKKVYGSRSVAVNMTAASQRILGPNPNRVRIQFCEDSVIAYSVAFGEAAVFNRGITIQPLTHDVVLTYEDIGEQIHAPIFAIGTGVATVGWLETNGECPCDGED